MKKILVPTDFSSVADGALRYAAYLAKKLETNLMVFHAGGKTVEDLRHHVVYVLNEPAAADHQFICADVDFNVDVVKTLISEHQPRLLVMGTHGSNTPFPPKIFGSNTAAVLEDSEVPVIAVPPDFQLGSISRISFAADLINFKKELLTVTDFAAEMNASVNVFHVTPIFPDIYDLEKTDVNAIIEEVKTERQFQFITYHIEETKRDNQIIKGINNFIDEHPTDLLVIFHTSRSWIDQIVTPSSTMKEISQIRVPLLVFPKKPED